MQLSIFNQKGQETGEKAQLEDNVFKIQPNDHVIYLDVRQYLAHQRQGTHKTKERGEVSGSTKKPYRQKGTGNARAGHIRSPLWRHGGTIFGPRPRKYGFKLNQKVKRLARRSALSYKVSENKLMVVDSIPMDKPKTQALTQVIENLKLTGVKSLFVTSGASDNLYLAARNLQGVHVITAQELNTYAIVNVEQIVLLKDSLPVIHSILSTSK